MAQDKSVLEKYTLFFSFKTQQLQGNSEIVMINSISMYFLLKIYIVIVDSVTKTCLLCSSQNGNQRSLSVLISLSNSEIFKGQLYFMCLQLQNNSCSRKFITELYHFSEKKIPTV